MRCDEFEERVHQSLDQRIAPSSQESLLRHTQQCRRCHDLLASYEQLSDGLGFFEVAMPGEDLPQRVVEQFSTIRTRRHRVALAAAVAVLAATVLLAILPGFFSRRGPGDVASPNQPAPAGGFDTPESTTGPRIGAYNAEAPGFDQNGVDIEQAHIFWDQWATRLKADRWEPVDRIAGEFAPITEPLSIAIEEIRSTIPLGRSNRATEPSSDSADTWLLPAIRDTA